MECYEENCLAQKIQTKNWILLCRHSSKISKENMQLCRTSLLTHVLVVVVGIYNILDINNSNAKIY
jgi:uncharacterized membrane protein YiaA